MALLSVTNALAHHGVHVEDGVTVHLLHRRQLHIRNGVAFGFMTFISGLTNDESLLLQRGGIGGRRKLGAGVFEPYIRNTI